MSRNDQTNITPTRTCCDGVKTVGRPIRSFECIELTDLEGTERLRKSPTKRVADTIQVDVFGDTYRGSAA